MLIKEVAGSGRNKPTESIPQGREAEPGRIHFHLTDADIEEVAAFVTAQRTGSCQ